MDNFSEKGVASVKIDSLVVSPDFATDNTIVYVANDPVRLRAARHTTYMTAAITSQAI